jgi:nitrite reductase/ring-hydroxylating ferredoxin subunit
VLVVEDAGSVYAVSNKCSHLGLPLQGKTAMFTATVRGARRRACTGGERGDGSVGGGGGAGSAAVEMPWVGEKRWRASRPSRSRPGRPNPYHAHTHHTNNNTKKQKKSQIKDGCVVCPAHNTAFSLKDGAVKGEWCPKFPQLPLVGKLGDAKPLPTFGCRVSEAGDVEVDV